MDVPLYRRTLNIALSAVLLFAGFPLLCAAMADQHNGRKYTPPPATATIKVTVVRATNGKAIPNAAVVFHPMEGDKDKGALELKSNEDGKVTIDVIPTDSALLAIPSVWRGDCRWLADLRR